MEIDKRKKMALLAGINERIEKKEQKAKLSKRKIFLSVAATVALIIIAIASINGDSGEYAAPYGAIKEVNLPDGSTVVLNANSSIRYEPRWTNAKDREVWLDGEAFFDISDQPKKGGPKFIVHTNYGDVNVLGTQFNVKERAKTFEVVLTEGAVSLSLNATTGQTDKLIKMTPGERVNLDVKTKILQQEQTNVEVFTSWMSKKLICDNTSIAYLATVIENNYGYEVEIADKAMLERKLTGTLDNPSLDDLIKAMSMAFNIKVQKTGLKKIRISY